MVAVLLYFDNLFFFIFGDGGMGEFYLVSSMMYFYIVYLDVINFLLVLVWNGYS